MNDEQSHPPSPDSPRKSWLTKISHFFQGEPKDREELVEVIQDAEERSLIDNNTKSMMEGVLNVSDLKVRDIMLPRAQMITLDCSQPVEKIIPRVIESAHSRFPVVNEDKDHIEGILLAKDLLPFGFDMSERPASLTSILRPAVVVPESKRVDKLLKEFREQRYHMAIVVDEFGSVSGLVTIEDILEQIVGDIEDEYDEEEKVQDAIRQVAPRVYSLPALTPVTDFNTFFHQNFSAEEIDTIGGAVMLAFGHMPSKGEEIEIEGHYFKVLNADRRRLLQLQVTVPESSAVDTSESTL